MKTFLFIGKEGDTYSELGASILKQYYPETATIIFSSRKTKIPEEAFDWEGDYVISYLSQWIIPQEILDKATHGAINFHPGPPEYPGIGCTNFAIYNREKVFGITCHYMLAKVDTGSIIEVRRFPVLENESVLTLTQKCYVEISKLYMDIIGLIAQDKSLPQSTENWTRKPYTRKQLNALCKIDMSASDEEILHCIHSTTYTKPWAFVKIAGKKFIYDGK